MSVDLNGSDRQVETVRRMFPSAATSALAGFAVEAGGVTYHLTHLKLQAHETCPIVLRQLRSAHNSDFRKNISLAASNRVVRHS
jgi:hypothetical protein